MTHEYGDPFNDETIAAAATRTVALARDMSGISLEEAAERAIHECICACAVDIEDSVERRRSGIHATLIDEVKTRAERQLAQEKAAAREAEIDEASEESFPASDPPAWIWERPPHKPNDQ